MRYAPLGRTGAFVSRICLGTMTFGSGGSPAASVIGALSQADTDRVVGQALDSGVNLLDTADVYSGGTSEERVGEALAGKRRQVLLATKLSARTGAGPNQVGQSRLHIMDALEDSLRRLKTDHIDLYQVHNYDPLTPLDEVLGALTDAVRQGKVRYIGCSNFMAWQLMKALGLSERAGMARFVSVQSYYSLAGRDIEREVLPAVRDQGLGLLCWSPLAGGLLSGKFDRSGWSDPAARRSKLQFPPVDRDRVLDVIDVLKHVASSRGVSAAQVALAWLLAQPGVTGVICGVKRLDQLADNLAAVELELTEEELKSLDAASAMTPSYPGWIQTYNARGRVPAGHPFTSQSWAVGEDPR